MGRQGSLVPLRRAAALLALALVSAEVSARLAVALVPPKRYMVYESEAWWRLRWLHGAVLPDSLFVFDERRGWAIRGGVSGARVGRGNRGFTNSKGARGPDEVPYERTDRPRIVVIGDSFAFGEGVADPMTFAAELGRLLPGAEVVNLGVGGYGHDQTLLHYRLEGRRYRPDLVLMPFIEEDALRNDLRMRDYAKPRFVREGAALRLEGAPVPSPEALRRRLLFWPRAYGLARCLWDALLPPRHDAARTELILDALRAEIEDGGAVTLFFSATRPEPGRLAAYCQARGLDCPIVPVEGLTDRGGHWSAAEHAQIARDLKAPVERALARRKARLARR